MPEIDNRNNYRGVKTVVLGASGFIGRWVARALSARKSEVHLVVRDKARAREIFSEYRICGDIFELDLRNAEAIEKLFRQIRPSITFNLAGYGVDRAERDEATAYQINAQLVKTICAAVAKSLDSRWAGQDIVHVGSTLEYGTISGDLREDSTPHPTTLYGKSKLAGTHLLAQHCQTDKIKGLTARLFTVYGPGEHAGRLLPALVETAQTKKPLPLTAGQQKRDFTYIEDVAMGLIRLGLSAAQPGETVNLATGRLTSVRAFAEAAAKQLQVASDKLQFGMVPTRAEEMEHSEVSVERLRQLLGWIPPTHVAEGIRRTLDFASASPCDRSRIEETEIQLIGQ